MDCASMKSDYSYISLYRNKPDQEIYCFSDSYQLSNPDYKYKNFLLFIFLNFNSAVEFAI